MFKRCLPLHSPQENAKLGVARDALAAYERGVMDPVAIPSFGQDIYEAGVLPRLPARYFLLLEHLKAVCLIHTHGRALH